MIRQAISCDICGAEKKQTNHWFVASEQAGELRISGWSSRNRLRSGSKHLCGQTCLHKLVDEFMAHSIRERIAAPANADQEQPEQDSAGAKTDASLTSPAAFADPDSSARPIAPAFPASLPPTGLSVRPSAIVSMPARPSADSPVPLVASSPAEESPISSSRRWRAEAWERERNRELRAVERHPDILRRRKGF